ncbi:SigE family RNA polymerase sigma factor [Actinokineospora cianjurensis]|uniref:RNA polymerase sigma-70 factor (Sigma-E family) n=1 Tax=Actinokineospora cianjurensis TaxID=585224 RepID=A0A421BAY2_9PSEU|nr:SigE family RNA polymerase sigma factor [Actinokineospora cianjurensis]RLK61410.1 RNA polymerase sigma-70 factor (sigma-E family) [Actinokineospora cianjurensis]
MSTIRPDDEFTEFVAHRSTALLRTAYLLCAGDRGAAEDLLQDVLERVYAKRRRVRGDLEPYVRRALANASANRWRSRSRRVAESPLDHAREQGTGGHEREVLDRDRIAKALGTLPPRVRAVLVLRFFDDLSEADTAAALGVSPGTVKSQTARGVARLRELLAETAPEKTRG